MSHRFTDSQIKHMKYGTLHFGAKVVDSGLWWMRYAYPPYTTARQQMMYGLPDQVEL